jgi:hypothetical protein
MGFFGKKRRNNDAELKEKCADGLYAIYKLLLTKVGEKDMEVFSRSLGIRQLFFGHVLSTYSYLVDTTLSEMDSSENDFIWGVIDDLMLSEEMEWDNTDPRPIEDGGNFFMQGNHISNSLIIYKDPIEWMRNLEMTAEHIKEFNSSNFQTCNFDLLKYSKGLT